MARKFRWKGVEYVAIETPLFVEMRAAEKAFGEGKQAKDSQDFTALEQVLAEVHVAVKRVDPKAVSWEELLNSSTDDLEMLEDDEPGPETEYVPDPLADGDQTEGSSSAPSPEPDPSRQS